MSQYNNQKERKMGHAISNFTFNGNKEQFLATMTNWMQTTTEGRRYRFAHEPSNSILRIKRGEGFWTAPIYISFSYRFYKLSFLIAKCCTATHKQQYKNGQQQSVILHLPTSFLFYHFTLPFYFTMVYAELKCRLPIITIFMPW